MASRVELQQYRRVFWRGVVRDGLSTSGASRLAGVPEGRARQWFRECGGVAPVDLAEPKGRYLSLAEREEIAIGLAEGLTQTAIAAQIGRNKGTVSRELHRNQSPGRPYRAVAAQAAAEARARRPKPASSSTSRCVPGCRSG